jgi:hypothetical protein
MLGSGAKLKKLLVQLRPEDDDAVQPVIALPLASRMSEIPPHNSGTAAEPAYISWRYP